MRTDHPIATKLGRYIHLIIFSTWLVLEKFCGKVFLAICVVQFLIPFSLVKHSICHIFSVQLMWKKEMSQLVATLSKVPLTLTLTFDLEFSRWNCISRMGGPIVMARKGWESIGCPDVKHYGDVPTWCCADLGTFDLEFSSSTRISGMGGTGRESIGCPDVKHYPKWVNWMLSWLRYIWPRPLTLHFQGQIVSWEWKAQLSWNETDG